MKSLLLILTFSFLISGCEKRFEFYSSDLEDYIPHQERSLIIEKCSLSVGPTSQECVNLLSEQFNFSNGTHDQKKSFIHSLRFLFFMPFLMNNQRPLLKEYQKHIPLLLRKVFYQEAPELYFGYYNYPMMLFFMQRVRRVQFKKEHFHSPTVRAKYEKSDGTLTIYNSMREAIMPSQLGILVHECLHYDLGLHDSSSGSPRDKTLNSPYGGGSLMSLMALESFKAYQFEELASRDTSAANSYFSACESLDKIVNLPKSFPQSLGECIGNISPYILSFE